MQIISSTFLWKTDVSKSGSCAISYKETTCWNFRTDRSLSCIKVLELNVVLFGLKCLCSHLRKTRIKMLAEHTSAMCAINKMGSCKSLLYIRKWGEYEVYPLKKKFLLLQLIFLVFPKEANQKSGMSDLKTERKLHKSISKNIFNRTHKFICFLLLYMPNWLCF